MGFRHEFFVIYTHQLDMSTNVKPLLLRYGGAAKSSFEMNSSELDQAASSIMRRAREKAFYKGLPVCYAENGKVLTEYPDGRIEVVKNSNNVAATIRRSRTQRNR